MRTFSLPEFQRRGPRVCMSVGFYPKVSQQFFTTI
jgi:hypothetical protein